MMNKKMIDKSNFQKTTRAQIVEGQIRMSAILPTMSFQQAKKYLGTLQEALVNPDDDIKDNLKTQLSTLCAILGVKESDIIGNIKTARLLNTTLKCRVEDIPEYVSLIAEQLRYDISEESKSVIRKQLAEAAFVTTY